jgi:hypothetical protein
MRTMSRRGLPWLAERFPPLRSEVLESVFYSFSAAASPRVHAAVDACFDEVLKARSAVLTNLLVDINLADDLDLY